MFGALAWFLNETWFPAILGEQSRVVGVCDLCFWPICFVSRELFFEEISIYGRIARTGETMKRACTVQIEFRFRLCDLAVYYAFVCRTIFWVILERI